MSALADVYAAVRLQIDGKGFEAQASAAGVKGGTAAGKSFSQKFGASMKTGLGIGAGFGAFSLLEKGIGGVVDVMQSSVAAASNLRESMSLTGQVFEGNTDKVATWAKGAESAFGQSKREALDFASNFGTAFKNVGLSLDETTDKAQEMTELAADLGSAFNASSAEAATALRSGLLGESEPLRRFGVFLDEAKTKAKGAAMGMKILGGKLTDGQKVAARYALIMEQTADSQGMFGRDTESLADTQKALGAEMENVQATIGEKLLPVMVDLVGFVRDDLVPVIEDAAKPGGTFDQFSDVMSDIGNSFDPQNAYEAKTALGELDRTLTDFTSDALDFLTPWDEWVSASAERESAIQDSATDLQELNRELTTASYGKWYGGFSRAADGITKAGDAAADAAPRVKDLGHGARDAAGSFKDLNTWARLTAEALTDNGADTLRLEFANAKLELRQNRSALADVTKEIDNLKAKGKPVPLELREKFNDLRIAVNNGETATADLGLQLVNTGGITFGALFAQLTKLGVKLDADTVKAGNLRDAIKLGTAYDNAGTGRGKAAGGPVTAGTPYIVGEKRAELFVPETNGWILPSVPAGFASPAVSGSGGGFSPTITIYNPEPRAAEADIGRVLRRTAALGMG